jgi:hypothetical protein
MGIDIFLRTVIVVNTEDFTKEELLMLYTSLQVVIKMSPLLSWEELEPKLKEHGVNLHETIYAHFLSDRQPSTLDKDIFTKTLAKVFKTMGSFMEAEGEEWQYTIEQLEKLTSKETITEDDIAEGFFKMQRNWTK